MKKKVRIISFVFCLIAFCFMFTDEVDAAKYHKGSKLLNTSDFGLGGGIASYYKKKVDDAIAYCPEFHRSAPSDGAKVTSFGSKYNKENFVAGQIIRIGRDSYSGEKEYMYIQQALNCYYKYPKSYLGGCTKAIDEMVSKAKKYVKNYKINEGSSKASLPKITISGAATLTKTANSTSANATYVSQQITVKGLDNTKYGSVGTKNTSSTTPQYKVALASSGGGVKLCKDAAGTSGCVNNGGSITDNGTYYLFVTNGGLNGGTASFKITGSNTSTYHSAKRWKNGDNQRLVTYTDDVVITRSVSANSSFRYAAADKYSASIAKVDDSGEILPGASLRLFTAADEDGKTDTVTLCTTNANDDSGACSREGMTTSDSYKYTTGRYICYSEATTPKGYTTITTHCDAINLGSKTEYYKMESNGDNEVGIEEADFLESKKYGPGDLTYQYASLTTPSAYEYDSNAKLYKYVYSDGRPSDYKPNDSEYRHEGTGGGYEWYIENGDTRINITVTEVVGTKVCHKDNNTTTRTEFCSGEYQYTSVTFSSGNVHINVGNALNFANISKKAISGDDEVPGATLSIYKADSDGKCTTNLATAKHFIYSSYTESDDSADDGSDDSSSGGDSGTPDSGEPDEEGQDVQEGNEELPDIAQTGLKWVSSNTPAIVYGLDPGNYCLQEELPPKGFKVSPTVVKFTMNESGEITNVAKDYYDENTRTLVIKDDYTSISISKADMATTKELPGAELKICSAAKNDKGEYYAIASETEEEGDCKPDLLADGTEAAWTSGTTPHQVVGLAAGTYFLVETTAPNGYKKAESILFVLNEDGVLTDANGNSLADKKLVMYDSPDIVKVPNTLANASLIASAIGAVLIACSVGGYLFINRKKVK